MAVNIAQGTDFPLFWYGQLYFGAVESYVAALMIKLFGFSELHMTLSPILFSQAWIVGTYLLYREVAGRKAGLIAVLVSVFPGYFLFYYNFALSGGYAIILALSVWILWSGVRVYNRPPALGWLWVQVLFTSVLAAIGIWVHYLIFPSLLVAAVYFFLHLVRQRFSPKVIFCYATGVGGALIGFLPMHLLRHYLPHGPSLISSFSFSWGQFIKSIQVLFTGNISQLLFWNFDHTLPLSMMPVYLAVAIVLLIMLALASRKLGVLMKAGQGGAALFPVLYLLFFLAMYLPHNMSLIKAPRYFFVPWSLILCTAWGYGLGFLQRRGRWQNILGIGLLCSWLVFQVSGSILFARSMVANKNHHLSNMRAVIDFAKQHGLDSVELVGSKRFGLEGQPLSMLAENRIKFVYANFERYFKNAQAMETAERYGILCPKNERLEVAESLRTLRVEFNAQDFNETTLFYDFHLLSRTGEALSPEGWKIATTGQVEGQGSFLLDHVSDSIVAWKEASEGMVEIDMGTEHPVNRLWLVTSENHDEGDSAGLPERFVVETAEDDGKYHSTLTVEKHVPGSYINGKRIFLSGFFAISECVFPSVNCRYLRMRFPKGQKIQLSELIAFTPDNKDALERGEDIFPAIQNVLQAEHIDLTLSDRWLSGLLMKQATKDHPFPALPRFNRYSATDESPSRLVIPRRGMVIAPALAVADLCRHLLEERFGPGVIRKYEVVGDYGLLFLNDVEPAQTMGFPFLYWNGNLLENLTTFDELSSVKLPETMPFAIKPQQEKTSGFYPDAWTNGKGVVKKLDRSIPDGSRYLVLYIAYPPIKEYEDFSKQLIVSMDGQPLKYSHIERNGIYFCLPPGVSRIREIQIQSSTFYPASSDHRQLGVNVPLIMVL